MDFQGHLDDAVTNMDKYGFTADLYIPDGDIEVEEEEAYEDPFPAQRLAALQCFLQLFAATNNRAWVHLAAEMQAGKTGVITTIIRLVLANAKRIKIRDHRIFVLTGMSDNAWKQQTRKRMPRSIRENVKHLRGLKDVATELHKFSASKSLSNVLIFLDESHIAAKEGNQPNLFIFEPLKRLCPMEEWAERNIRVVTISATDPAKVMAIGAETKMPCSVVRLQTDANYQSVASLKAANRIRFIEDTGELHMCEGSDVKCNCLGSKHSMPALDEIEYAIAEDFDNEPLYHILRPRVGQQDLVVSLLKKRMPDTNIILWDAETHSKKKDEDKSSASLDDINNILDIEPEVTTFIVLKNMLYAAKTMHDQHVGILYDRISGKDDTTLQSLLGRACGYGRSKRTIVYTSSQTITNYEKCWKELCSNANAPTLRNIPATFLDKKMEGVKASAIVKGKTAKLSVVQGMATPYGMGLGVDPNAGSASGRKTANEDDFEMVWKEFNTFEEAKKHAPRTKEKKVLNGFYQSSTTSGAVTLSYAEVLKMKSGKKTANLPSGMKVGGTCTRMYIGYKDLTDPTSVVFAVRTIKKIR